jgi:hypothetical protein
MLKRQTNDLMWQEEKGFFLTHAHVTPLEHNFDETAMVSIANALAAYAGLTDFAQNQALFDSLEQARLKAGAKKPGLSIYPFYPNKWPERFFDYEGMGYGNYQNGGVWDWWGGVQIRAEFLTGFAEAGQTHLLQVANDWQKHPGNIIEWHSTTDARHEGSHYYSAAAGTMGSAIIEGFFGLELNGAGLVMQPRLGLNDGFIRIYQPATDRYAAYSYDWDQNVTRLDYGTNAEAIAEVKVLKLRSEHVRAVTIDGQAVGFSNEITGNDTYTVFSAPSGQHRIELLKGTPLVQPASVSGAPAAMPATATPAPGAMPNPVSSPDAVAAQEQIGSAHKDIASPEKPATRPAAKIAASDTPTDSTSKDEANNQRVRETRRDFFRFISASLVILTSLFLMVLVAIRRSTGLN